MSIDEAKPEDWDKAFGYVKNNGEFKIEDATCVLPAGHHEMMRRERETWTQCGPLWIGEGTAEPLSVKCLTKTKYLIRISPDR